MDLLFHSKSWVKLLLQGRKRKTEISMLNDKLNSLIDQNKVMANGIILLEGYLRGRRMETRNIPGATVENKEEEKIKKLPQYRF